MLKIQILDDDPWMLELLSRLIESAIPNAVVSSSLEPTPTSGHDVYVLDNRFGVDCAQITALSDSIRQETPHAAIFACSSTLGEVELKSLLNAGCAGVADKRVPGDLAGLVDRIRRLDELRGRRHQRERLSDKIRGVRLMLRDWKTHLDLEEQSQDSFGQSQA